MRQQNRNQGIDNSKDSDIDFDHMDTSIRIDKYRTREAAKERSKEQEQRKIMRKGQTTTTINKKTRVPQRYKWSTTDDSPEDEVDAHNRFMDKYIYNPREAWREVQDTPRINTTRRPIIQHEKSNCSTDTDNSIQIDKHRTRKPAEIRRKEQARMKEMRQSSSTRKNRTPQAKQPYIWGDEDDDTPEDKEEVDYRFRQEWHRKVERNN